MNSQRYVRVANGIQIQYGQKVNKKGENQKQKPTASFLFLLFSDILYISLLKYGEKRNASRHEWQHKLYEKAGKIRNEFSRRKETDCSKYK